MDITKIKTATEKLKKYTPNKLSVKTLKENVAYTIGFTTGYLFRTKNPKEIDELLHRD